LTRIFWTLSGVGTTLSDTYADVAILTYFFWFAQWEYIFGSLGRGFSLLESLEVC